MTKMYFRLAHDEARRRAATACYDAPDSWIVTIAEPNRTLEQNAAQWPYLVGFAEQKQLCVNGVMQWVTDEDWKDVLTACYEGEMRIATFDGRVILLPKRTSKFTKPVFSNWMEYLVAMAAQCGVEPIYKSERRMETA